jgi:hypothetical protein
VLAIVTVDPEFRDAGVADWVYDQVRNRALQDGARHLDTIVDSKDRDALVITDEVEAKGLDERALADSRNTADTDPSCIASVRQQDLEQLLRLALVIDARALRAIAFAVRRLPFRGREPNLRGRHLVGPSPSVFAMLTVRSVQLPTAASMIAVSLC